MTRLKSGSPNGIVIAGERTRDGEPRVGQRIALARLRQQYRGLRSRLEVARMRRKRRHQQDRGAVGRGRDVDQRGEGPAFFIKGRQTAGAYCSQKPFGLADRIVLRVRRGILTGLCGQGSISPE